MHSLLVWTKKRGSWDPYPRPPFFSVKATYELLPAEGVEREALEAGKNPCSISFSLGFGLNDLYHPDLWKTDKKKYLTEVLQKNDNEM